MNINPKKHLIFTLFITVLLFSCDFSEPSINGDIIICSANVLSSNSKSAYDITKSLLKHNADIYLMHDGQLGKNIDKELLLKSGYTVFSHLDSSVASYQGVLASRLSAEYESLDFSYTYKDLIKEKKIKIAPFYALRIVIDSVPISVIGAHIPHTIKMSTDLEKLRENAFKDISSIINDGKISKDINILRTGDYAILGGDLNSFPSDPLLNYILDSGMEDSFLANPRRYDKSWTPLGVNVARIDYIFHSKHLSGVYNSNVTIPGSDHKAVIAGINIQ